MQSVHFSISASSVLKSYDSGALAIISFHKERSGLLDSDRIHYLCGSIVRRANLNGMITIQVTVLFHAVQIIYCLFKLEISPFNFLPLQSKRDILVFY